MGRNCSIMVHQEKEDCRSARCTCQLLDIQGEEKLAWVVVEVRSIEVSSK